MAYFALDRFARLSVHPARRKPERYGGDLSKPDDYDAPRRPLARRVVDVRVLGRISRPVAIALPRLWRGLGLASSDGSPSRHVPACRNRLGVLPVRDVFDVARRARKDVRAGRRGARGATG